MTAEAGNLSTAEPREPRPSIWTADRNLAAHPEADQVVTAAYGQPRPQAASNLRNYFTSHPNEYYDLRGILSPIGDTEGQCNVTALPPNLESAYHEFMAG